MSRSVHLIILVGLTPQVITEALYAVVVQEGKRVERISVFTTPEGGRTVENSFLLGSDTPLNRFCQAYGVSRNTIHFSDKDVYVVWNAGPIEEQSTSADQIFNKLAAWTGEGAPPLVACVTGGRKHMAVLFSQAFSLVARPEDRLFHLLVSNTFQNLPDFFYPSPQPCTLPAHIRGQGMVFLNSAEAQVVSVEIPVVRLRPLIDEEVRRGLVSMAAGQAALQHAVTDSKGILKVNVARRQVQYQEMSVILPPREFALYHFFCGARLQGLGPGKDGLIPISAMEIPELVDRLEAVYRRALPQHATDGTFFVPRDRHDKPDYNALFGKVTHSVSKIKAKLGIAHPGRVMSIKQRRTTYYGITLPIERIQLEEPDDE